MKSSPKNTGEKEKTSSKRQSAAYYINKRQTIEPSHPPSSSRNKSIPTAANSSFLKDAHLNNMIQSTLENLQIQEVVDRNNKLQNKLAQVQVENQKLVSLVKEGQSTL